MLRLVLPLVIVLVVISAVPILQAIQRVSGPLAPGNNRGTINLVRPVSAGAATSTFLDQEAGITGYVNLARTIDLTNVVPYFRTIEQQTPNYVVGSVALPLGTGYTVQDDIHVFVTATGWVAGYYNKTEPTSKFVDWNGYAAGTPTIPNKLALGLSSILPLGITPASLQYYDFAYPNANNLYVIADRTIFYITIPSQFGLQEVSYSGPGGVGRIAILSANTRHSVQCGGNGGGLIIDNVPYIGTCTLGYPYFLVLVYFG